MRFAQRLCTTILPLVRSQRARGIRELCTRAFHAPGMSYDVGIYVQAYDAKFDPEGVSYFKPTKTVKIKLTQPSDVSATPPLSPVLEFFWNNACGEDATCTTATDGGELKIVQTQWEVALETQAFDNICEKGQCAVFFGINMGEAST